MGAKKGMKKIEKMSKKAKDGKWKSVFKCVVPRRSKNLITMICLIALNVFIPGSGGILEKDGIIAIIGVCQFLSASVWVGILWSWVWAFLIFYLNKSVNKIADAVEDAVDDVKDAVDD